jgi:hypothetical protein
VYLRGILWSNTHVSPKNNFDMTNKSMQSMFSLNYYQIIPTKFSLWKIYIRYCNLISGAFEISLSVDLTAQKTFIYQHHSILKPLARLSFKSFISRNQTRSISFECIDRISIIININCDVRNNSLSIYPFL